MPGEEGLTNLGRVPKGMTFAQATAAMRSQRKWIINPHDNGHRLTICDTLRHIWRELDKMPDCAPKDQIRDYLGAAFDYAKRMDRRMRELKGENA